MKYFSLEDDIDFVDRWYLGGITVNDNYIFTKGQSVDISQFINCEMEIDQKGIEMDFTTTDVYLVPIISEALAEQLFEYGDYIQLIPVTIPKIANKYYILVINQLIDCINEEKSEFEKFEEGNQIRPDLVGEYFSMIKLMIDKERANAPIFRLKNYDVEIIVNEEIKEKLENAKLTGLHFELVSF